MVSDTVRQRSRPDPEPTMNAFGTPDPTPPDRPANPTEPVLPASLAASSRFVKRATCARCGAPKTRPSKTAYLYCDKCGALVDYDFRIANIGTNAGITNTIYQQLAGP